MAYFNTLANNKIEQPMDLNKNVIQMNRLLERKNHLEELIRRLPSGSIEIGYTYRGKKYNFKHDSEEVNFIVECCSKELKEVNNKIDELTKAE